MSDLGANSAAWSASASFTCGFKLGPGSSARLCPGGRLDPEKSGKWNDRRLRKARRKTPQAGHQRDAEQALAPVGQDQAVISRPTPTNAAVASMMAGISTPPGYVLT
jgi:hypothetical protein